MPSEKPNIFEIRDTCTDEADVLESKDLQRFLNISRSQLGLNPDDLKGNPVSSLDAFLLFRKFNGIFSQTNGKAINTVETLTAILIDKVSAEGKNMEFPARHLGFFERAARTFMARGLVPVIMEVGGNPFGSPIYPSDEGHPNPIGKQAKIKLVALPNGIRYSNMSKPKSPEEIWADGKKNGLGFEAAKEGSHAGFATLTYNRTEGGRPDPASEDWSEAVTLPRGAIESELLEQNRQYGCALFEGIGVEYGDDGEICIFRLDEHADRMSKGGEFFDMPPIPTEIYRELIEASVLANSRYIPPKGKGRLYVRPNWFDKGPKMHVGNSNLHALTVTAVAIGSVESYFKPGRKTLLIPRNAFRASKNGMGQTKGVGSYATTILINNRANEKEMTGVLYTDEAQSRMEETLASSIIRLIKRNGKIILQTPTLDHNTILDSVTRKSVIKLASEELGWNVEVTDITPESFIHSSDEVLGVYAAGTAAGLAPIHGVRFGDFNSKEGEIENLEDEIALLNYDQSNPMGAEGSKLLKLLLEAKNGRLQKRKMTELTILRAKKNAGEDIDEEHLSELNTLVAEYESWLTRLRA